VSSAIVTYNNSDVLKGALPGVDVLDHAWIVWTTAVLIAARRA
jgi:hypothetical protein